MQSNDTRPRCRAASEVQALGAGSQPRTPNTLRHPFSYATREIRETPLAWDGAELRVYGGLFGWAAPSTESKSGRCEIQLRTLRVKYGQYPMADRNGTRTVIAIEAARQHDGLAGHLDQFVFLGGDASLAGEPQRNLLPGLNTVVAGFLWKLGDRETAVLVEDRGLRPPATEGGAGREDELEIFVRFLVAENALGDLQPRSEPSREAPALRLRWTCLGSSALASAWPTLSLLMSAILIRPSSRPSAWRTPA